MTHDLSPALESLFLPDDDPFAELIATLDTIDFPVPETVETLGALSPAAISRLYSAGGTIKDFEGEEHDVRQAIDRTLWGQRQRQRREQQDWFLD